MRVVSLILELKQVLKSSTALSLSVSVFNLAKKLTSKEAKRVAVSEPGEQNLMRSLRFTLSSSPSIFWMVSESLRSAL